MREDEGYTSEDRRLASVNREDRWHLSKSVPVSIIIFLVMQTIGIVIWGTKLDSRVAALEGSQPLQDTRLERLEQIYPKIAVLDDRVTTIMRRMEVQTDKLNQILGVVLKQPTIK